MTSPSDLYEDLCQIGKGAFGVIRKVRRKTDGAIFARKEIDFERMSEKDRKQILAEVNILSELNHDHIVKYIEKYVDKGTSTLNIIMEYCDGGDLSSIIRQSSRMGKLIPEDTVWQYFYQLLLALNYCHCPNTSSNNKPIMPGDPEPRRQPILHRDIKPENVFVSNGNTVKLGDFGLSKALVQTSFASTYVGTPYYMSPEVMHKNSYDSKSDIWSLGCLIYELCAGIPPFHDAKSHSELLMLVRNGRIPPLPKGYSSAMSQTIKAMMNLNPAARPSTQQLLHHERIEFARKVSDTEKMLLQLKTLKSNLAVKERDLQALNATLQQREAALTSVVSQKDAEIARLTNLVNQADRQIRAAVVNREEELRMAVMQREEEVRVAMRRREEEIMEAVRNRENEINLSWTKQCEQLQSEWSNAIEWMNKRQKELEKEAEELEQARADFIREIDEIQCAPQPKAAKTEGIPHEEVNVTVESNTSIEDQESEEFEGEYPQKSSASFFLTSTIKQHRKITLETPKVGRIGGLEAQLPTFPDILGSAMKGVVLTATGENLRTPGAALGRGSRAALTEIIEQSPNVQLNFRKIFDFSEPETDDDEGDDDDDDNVVLDDTITNIKLAPAYVANRVVSGSSVEPPELQSPTKRIMTRTRTVDKEREREKERERDRDREMPKEKEREKREKLKLKDRQEDRRVGHEAEKENEPEIPPAMVTIRTKPEARVKARVKAIPRSSPVGLAGHKKATSQSVLPTAMTRVRRTSSLAPVRMPTSKSLPVVASSRTRVVTDSSSPSGPESSSATASEAATTSNKLEGLLAQPAPKYNTDNEETLPSPFIKRLERKGPRVSGVGPAGATVVRRKSAAHLLRLKAATNSANNAMRG